MPSAIEYMQFFYPYLLDEADPRHVPLADVDMALAMAADYRPTCLVVDRQNQAQAHYTAYLLEFRTQQVATGGGGVSSTSTTVTAGPIVEKSEGDLRVRYSEGSTKSTTAVTTSARNANAGPSVAYAAWLGLWAICNPTDLVVVGPPDTGNVVPVRRGGIITKAGLPPTG